MQSSTFEFILSWSFLLITETGICQTSHDQSSFHKLLFSIKLQDMPLRK